MEKKKEREREMKNEKAEEIKLQEKIKSNLPPDN